MTTATDVDIIGTVIAARTPRDLFGDGDPEDKKGLYRRLLRNVHPDRHPGDARAEDAFKRLTDLWNELTGVTAQAAVVLASKRHTYTLAGLLRREDVANAYRATYDDGHESCVLKIARQPRDRDLVAAEVKALKALRDVPDDFKMYHHVLLDAFRQRDSKTRQDRAAVVIDDLPGFYTLAEVAAAYPNGVDPKDVAWIFRRMLVGIGTAHDVGIIHGAVVPNRVLVMPEMHGIVLTDWTCSVELGAVQTAVAANYRHLYSERTFEKKPADRRVDIALAAKTAEFLGRTRTPTQFRAFFKGCTISAVPTAAELLHEFDELLEEMYGKRRFHPFAMPTREDA